MVNLRIIRNRKIKIGIVGCGRISNNHIKAISMHPNQAEIVALCDKNLEALNKARAQLNQLCETDKNPQLFTDYDYLINASKENKLKIDLIVLATPSGMHPLQVIKAANANIHVCTEKPMATKWEDGIEMVKACEKASVHLFVVKQNRFNSTLQLVKKQLEKKRFGKLALITVNVFWHRPQEYYDQASWRGTIDYDGGALMNQASHYVDLLDWLIGPVESLSASIATISRKIEVEDTASIQLKWKNGALGTMAVTMLTFPKNLEGSITILGEKGTVKIGGNAVNKIEHWNFEDNCKDDLLIEKASYDTTSVYGFGHKAYYSNLFDVLNGLANPMCNGSEGLKSLELLIAAYKSAKNKKVIELPLES
tara:strand:+ start:5837 stop:6934 length:1098 start_codon:yes stop_codon:yes gene_type:complete